MGVTATAIGTFLGLQGATATVVGATTILAATAAVSYGVAKLTAPDLDDFSQLGRGGKQLNTKEPNAPIEIVYGAVRKGGVVAYQTTTSSQVLGLGGGNNRVLRQIIVVAGHEVYDMNPTRIWLDDVEWVVNEYGYVTDQKFVDGVQTTDNQFKYNSSTNRSFLFVGKHRGNQTSPDDLFQGLSALGGLSGSMSLNHKGVTGPLNNHPVDGKNDALANFVGRGIAFMYVEMIFDPEVFDNIPLVTTLVEGKKVYDPEFGTTAYSNNPAHCILDYLESEYGLNVDTAYTDRGTSGTFKLAADDCYTDSGTTPNNAFKCNGILSGADSHKTNLEKLLSSCDGTLIFSGGKWKLIIGKDRSSTATTLTLDNFRGPISVQTKASKSERFNEVGGDFVDASNRWLQGSYPAIKSATFLSDDDGQVSRFELSLPMTTSSVIAQRLAKIQLYRSREEVVVTVRCDLAALDLDVGDWVKLVIDRYGWTSAQNKYFEVRGYSMVLENGAPEIELVLKEISSAVFDWDSEEADITTDDAYPFSIGNILSSLNSLATPTATASGYFLSDGTYQPTIDVTWSGLDDIYLDGYQLKYYVTSAGDSTAAEITLGRDATFYRILTDGSSGYTIELRAFSGRTMGIYKTLTKTSAEDTTAPAVPTSFSVTAGHKHVAIQATAPSDSDFQAIEIYRVAAGSTAPTSSTTPSFSISGAPATVLKTIDDNLTNGTALDFYARSRDYTGNTSDWTSKQTATPTQEYTDGATVGAQVGVNLSDADGNAISTNAEIKNDEIINVGGDGNIKTDLVVADSILAATITNVEIASGTIKAANIEANTITANEIKSNTITAAEIASATITANEIASNTITATQIAGDTITANEIASGTITASEIATGTITANELAATNLSSIFIDAGTITTGVLQGGATPPENANDVPATGKAGAYLDLTNGRFVFGDENRSILFDGTDVKINGDIITDLGGGDNNRIVYDGDILDITGTLSSDDFSSGYTLASSAISLTRKTSSESGAFSSSDWDVRNSAGNSITINNLKSIQAGDYLHLAGSNITQATVDSSDRFRLEWSANYYIEFSLSDYESLSDFKRAKINVVTARSSIKNVTDVSISLGTIALRRYNFDQADSEGWTLKNSGDIEAQAITVKELNQVNISNHIRNNLIIGDQQTLGSLTTGLDNTAIGMGAASSITNGSDNVIIGKDAGADLKTNQRSAILLGNDITAYDDATNPLGMTAIGGDARAIGEYVTVVGTAAKAGDFTSVSSNTPADYSTVVGALSKSSANYGIAIGYLATVENSSALHGIAVGYNSEAGGNGGTTGVGGIAIGYEAKSRSDGQITIGYSANLVGSTTATDAIAIGKDAAVSGSGAVGVGKDVYAAGANSVAIGADATASAQNSIAIGNDARAGQNTIALNSYATGTGSIIIGVGGGVGNVNPYSNRIQIGTNQTAVTVGNYDLSTFATDSDLTGFASEDTAVSFTSVTTNTINTTGLTIDSSTTISFDSADGYFYFLDNGTSKGYVLASSSGISLIGLSGTTLQDVGIFGDDVIVSGSSFKFNNSNILTEANNGTTTTTKGSGYGALVKSSVVREGAIITTTFIVSTDGMRIGGITNDVVGTASAANAFFAQLGGSSVHGTLLSGYVECLFPSTANFDWDLGFNDDGLTESDDVLTAGTNGGKACLGGSSYQIGERKYFLNNAVCALPAANAKLYVTQGANGSALTLSGGLYRVVIFGHA